MGKRRELPQWGPGRSPGRKRISVLSKHHRMPLVEMFVVNCEAPFLSARPLAGALRLPPRPGGSAGVGIRPAMAVLLIDFIS